MSTWLDPKKITVIAAIVVAVAVAGLLALLTFVKPINPAYDNLAKTEINSAAENLIPDGKLASLMGTPATAEWWARLNQYSPVSQLRHVDYAALPAQPVSLGWSLSAPKGFTGTESLGLNTIYIQLSSPEDAVKVQEYLSTTIGDKAGILTAENFVLILPFGAYSDVEFNLDAYQSLAAQNKGTVIKEATWTVNFAALQQVLAAGDPAEETVWANMVSAFGAKASTDSVYWAGTSEDGLNWKGDLSASNLWTAAAISSVDLQKAADSNTKYYLTDGTEVSKDQLSELDKKALADALATKPGGEDPTSGVASGITSLYFLDGGTVDALSSMLVRNSDTAFGTMTAKEFDSSTPNSSGAEVVAASKLESGANYTEITVNPNVWLSEIREPQGTRHLYVLFDQLTLKLYNNSSDMDITLRVAPWADKIDDPAQIALDNAPEGASFPETDGTAVPFTDSPPAPVEAENPDNAAPPMEEAPAAEEAPVAPETEQ